MNEFTMEELQQIKFDMIMGHNRFDASFTNEMYLALEIKIQSLIDNYCEHEYEEDRHHMDIYLCPKCGKREWWENK